jgi:FkbH-like protein
VTDDRLRDDGDGPERNAMYLPDGFDYIKLMGLGRDQSDDDQSARVAVLGFCTTQYYTATLRGLGKAGGFPVVTYEPEYNTVHQTVLDAESALYSFRPDFVVILTAVQALRTVLLSVGPTERVEAAEREARQLVSIVKRAAEIPGVTIVVNEFVVPYERAWGNLSGRIDGSLPNAVRRVNERLRQLAVEAGNVYTIDADHIASWIGKRVWFDERLWFYSKSFCNPEALPHVAGQAIDIFRAVKGRSFKCVALDLDNVLWGGTIGDDGLEGIRLGELGEGEAFVQVQTWLSELRARGIILSICSKNDDEKAREPFRSHTDMVLKEADISCFIANWDDKAQNLRELARRLNIGLDSIVFLDDSPFERNLVRDLVPEVCVPEMPADPAEFVPYLESLNLFEATQFSEEDRQRGDFYRSNALRESEEARFADVNEYLVSLEMEAEFEQFDDLHLPRIAQLVQRTNQFNLTTIRHSAAELKGFANDPEHFPFYVTLTDRFGDNGLICVLIGKRDGATLDLVTWLMSCRVISRRLEEFVLDQLVDVARDAGMSSLRGRYVPTTKNGLVSKHYEKLGFALTDALPDGSTDWRLDVHDHVVSDAPIAKRALVEQ